MEHPPGRPQDRSARAARAVSTAYAAALSALMPLAFGNGYFDITETKQAVFLAASLAYLLALAAAYIWLRPDTGARLTPRPFLRGMSGWCALIMLFSVLACCLVNGFSPETLFAPHGRYQGLLSVTLYVCTLLCLAKTGVNLRVVEIVFTAGASLTALLALLNHFGLDPLGLMTTLTARDRGRFLSTIGNVNFYAAYVSLALPVAVGLFCRADRMHSRIPAAAALLAVSLGTLAAGSESAALAFMAAAVVFPGLLFGHPRAFKRCLLAAALFALAAFAFGRLETRFPAATNGSYFFRLLTKPPLALALAFLFASLPFMLRRIGAARLARAQKPYLIACGALLLAGGLAVLLLNTGLKDVPLGPLTRFLRWGESWGTDRGRIWAYCVRLYASYPPGKLLFGGGPGALFAADQLSPLFADAALDSAHNEYLQYLLAFGAFGLASYAALLLAYVRAGLSACKRRPALAGFLAAVIAYIAQAAVNIAQPMTTPLFFLCLGLLAAGSKSDETPPEPDDA